jgi:hypothetical protein
MKISELIKKLQDEIEKYGDIDVYQKDYDWGDIDDGVVWEYVSEEDNLKYLDHHFEGSYIKKDCLIFRG